MHLRTPLSARSLSVHLFLGATADGWEETSSASVTGEELLIGMFGFLKDVLGGLRQALPSKVSWYLPRGCSFLTGPNIGPPQELVLVGPEPSNGSFEQLWKARLAPSSRIFSKRCKASKLSGEAPKPSPQMIQWGVGLVVLAFDVWRD